VMIFVGVFKLLYFVLAANLKTTWLLLKLISRLVRETLMRIKYRYIIRLILVCTENLIDLITLGTFGKLVDK